MRRLALLTMWVTPRRLRIRIARRRLSRNRPLPQRTPGTAKLPSASPDDLDRS